MDSSQKQKVLIVKLGFDETIGSSFNPASITVSLGDIFRTTALLHLFKNDHVTWLTSKEGVPLLEGNPYIERILTFDMINVLQLQSEYFDIIANLEKVPGICALTDSIQAWKRYGFRFDAQKGNAEAYDGAYNALASFDIENRKKINKYWNEMLFDMFGAKWNGESYILGYKPKTKEVYDVGFNIHVGNKWPVKAWSMKNWQKLEKLIRKKYSVSYQQSLDNIHEYIDWINSCRLLVTNDSLGLHLALSLKKKVIGLFGPTPHTDIYFSDLGVPLTPMEKLDCMPCFSSKCIHTTNCIDVIKPETVYQHIESLLK